MMCGRRIWIAAASGLLVLVGTLAGSTAATGNAVAHRAALCALSGGDRFALDPRPPGGGDPLTGARFFLDGPGTNRGFAATAMAELAGRDPNSFGNVGWQGLEGWLSSRTLSPEAAHQINLLEKIGSQPEVKRFSVYSAGGGPGAIYSQVQKLLCRMQATDPGADALISTYFLKHAGYCPTLRETPSDQAVFRRHIDELAAGVGDFPTVILLETDAIDTAGCLSRAGLRDREALLAYAIDQLSQLPHAVVYVEAGTEDAETPQYAARVLNAIGIQKIRGFFLNDTHFNWTANEVRFGHRVSVLTHGLHFIVGTQVNGRGPLLNPDPVHQGIEDLCNPPGRGLGPRLTTDTGVSAQGVDAFMWVGVPGRSAGPCHPGEAPPGDFDLGFALQLAEHANAQLGPGYPSAPY
jgi:endoglucanase